MLTPEESRAYYAAYRKKHRVRLRGYNSRVVKERRLAQKAKRMIVEPATPCILVSTDRHCTVFRAFGDVIEALRAAKLVRCHVSVKRAADGVQLAGRDRVCETDLEVPDWMR